VLRQLYEHFVNVKAHDPALAHRPPRSSLTYNSHASQPTRPIHTAPLARHLSEHLTVPCLPVRNLGQGNTDFEVRTKARSERAHMQVLS